MPGAADRLPIRALRRLVPLLLALSLAACAAPLKQQLASGDRGVVVVHQVIESDTEDSLIRRNVETTYDMNLTISPKVHRDGADDGLEGAPLGFEKRDGGKVTSLWRAYSLLPGSYVITRIHEIQATGLTIWDKATKDTWFVTQTPLKKDGIPVAYASAATPQFEVRAGTVTFIGTFGARLTTDHGEFVVAPFVKQAVKYYALDAAQAKEVVAKSPLTGYPLQTVDVFAGRADALAIYEKPWSDDEDQTLHLPTGQTAALPAARP